MMDDKLAALVQAVRHWAEDEIDRLVYSGTRPLSVCPSVEAATREAAIARGNAVAHSAEINEIESISTTVTEWLTFAAHARSQRSAQKFGHD